MFTSQTQTVVVYTIPVLSDHIYLLSRQGGNRLRLGGARSCMRPVGKQVLRTGIDLILSVPSVESPQYLLGIILLQYML